MLLGSPALVFCRVFCCAVQRREEPTHDPLRLFFFCDRVGGQFLLNAASFKSSRLWLEIEIMIHRVGLASACLCLRVDKQIQEGGGGNCINVFYSDLIMESICGGSSSCLILCPRLTSGVYPHQLSSACFLNRLCVELLTHYDNPSIGASALFVCLQTATD